MTEEKLTCLTTMSVHHAEYLSLQTETFVIRRFVQEKSRRLFCNLMNQKIINWIISAKRHIFFFKISIYYKYFRSHMSYILIALRIGECHGVVRV